VAHRGRRNADDALAVALAAGKTLRDAAVAAGIGERTATRRWADLAFRRRVGELRADMVQRSLGRLADSMSEAAAVLWQLLGAATPPAVRLGACRALLELGVKLRESSWKSGWRHWNAPTQNARGPTVGLERRIKALERTARDSRCPRCPPPLIIDAGAGPALCLCCGRPADVIEIVEMVVDSRKEALGEGRP
jgi:hypothetical protein